MRFTIFADPSSVIIAVYVICLIHALVKTKKKRINIAFSPYGHTPAHEALPWGHEIYNFGSLFFSHHNYFLSSSDLCLGVEKKVLKEIMHFHYMTYMATL